MTTTSIQSRPAPIRPRTDRAARAGAAPLLTGAGRIAFAAPFAVFGVLHLMNAEAMAGMVPVPGGVFWIYLTGLALLAGAVGLGARVLGSWAALGLAALLGVFILTLHLPGLGDPQTRQMALTSGLKDLALLGGALTWAGILRAERRAG